MEISYFVVCHGGNVSAVVYFHAYDFCCVRCCAAGGSDVTATTTTLTTTMTMTMITEAMMTTKTELTIGKSGVAESVPPWTRPLKGSSWSFYLLFSYTP